ncbi:MBL fold metallo-hydrolase [Actinoplanes cyaneus]|uniref:MBL fold metallo-hydrolase n=1 Tax=Actinoplanes cyaneus TaxID=52696 RepID=A0A919IRD4_9ACTN|nr:MBL fold metallo-hydrolase [Actinoplanes cyaneus]MCW2139742.1 cyclase [Actinoplanes cyaneus]GID69897.1 MBL fold metallo-hydrolase [Actinoplanes cyaneus]
MIPSVAGPELEASLTEVADGVYAYVQPPGGWCVSNAGVVAGPDGALVIDTLATERRARRLRDAVDALRPGPRRTVVNTHHHGDHNFGNHLFGPAAQVVAHELARTEMAATGMALTGLWPDVQWGDVRVTLPTLTFAGRAAVHVGDRRVELLHVGPAHTTNDVVAWLPDERVLFAGDVVLSGSTPFNLMGSVSGALVAVRRLRELGARTIVCGHGPVAGPEVFDTTTDYLEWIQRLAADGAAAGLTPLEVARESGTGDFGHLIDPERIVGNLHRAYAELGPGDLGRPLDVVSIFGEMVEYNDGLVPTCLA